MTQNKDGAGVVSIYSISVDKKNNDTVIKYQIGPKKDSVRIPNDKRKAELLAAFKLRFKREGEAYLKNYYGVENGAEEETGEK